MHLNLHELRRKFLVVTSWAELSWLLRVLCDLLAFGWHFLLQKFILTGAHPLPHLFQLPNIESYFLPSPPAPMGQVVVRAFYPFLFPSSWYPDLPVDTRIVLSSCPKSRACWSLAFHPVLTSVSCYWYQMTSLELALGNLLDYGLNGYWMSVSDKVYCIYVHY